MAGKPELSAAPGVQNVVVYVSNDNFAQAYAVGQQNVAPNYTSVVGPPKHFPDKSSLPNGHLVNETLQSNYFFPQPIAYPNGIVNQVKSYGGGNGEVLSGERQAGPGRPREDCDNHEFESGYVTVMGAEGPPQSVRCDSVRSETAESSCSSLSSADEGMVVLQNQTPEMVVYDSSVSVRPGGVVFAVSPGTLPHGNQQPSISVPYGWKRIVSNGSIIYISPSNTALSSPEQVKEYLLTSGTCKCGLECHFKYDSTFSFDPKVASKPWTLSPDTNTGDLTKLCNHKRKIIAMAALDCKPPDPSIKLRKDCSTKRNKRKIGMPYGGCVPLSQIFTRPDKLALSQQFNKEGLANQPQVWPQSPTSSSQLGNRIQNYQENQQMMRYQGQDPSGSRILNNPLVVGDSSMMVQQTSNSTNISQQVHQNHQMSNSNSQNPNIHLHHQHIIGPNGQVISLQGPINSNQISSNGQPINQIVNTSMITNPNNGVVIQGQNVVPTQSHQHRVFINSQPSEPSGPGRPNIQMIPVGVQRQDVQNRLHQHFYNNQQYPQIQQYDISKQIRPAFLPGNNQIMNGFRPQGVVNSQNNQIMQAPAMMNNQQRLQWANRIQPNNISQQNQMAMAVQNSSPNAYERVPPLHQHTPPPSIWQEEVKRKKVKLGKIVKNRPYHVMECSSLPTPCPNIDVRQIPGENGRSVIINHLPQNNQNAASPSFMEDPSGYLAQQTALLNNTINRQTGANACTGMVCNSPITSSHNPQTHNITPVPNSQTNEVPLPSNVVISQMRQTQNISNRTNQSLNIVKTQQVPHNIVMSQQYNQMMAHGVADSSDHIQCQGCVSDSVSHHLQSTKGHSRPNSQPGTPSSSGAIDDPVTSSTYSDKQSNLSSPDSRPIQGGTVSTSNVSPLDGSQSDPPTPNPHTPTPPQSSHMSFAVYNQQGQVQHVSQSRDVCNSINYQKQETCCSMPTHSSVASGPKITSPYTSGIVTTMASGRTVGSNTITSVLAGRANTATVSINGPAAPTAPTASGSIQQQLTMNVSKSPLEMVQSVVSSIQVPHSQHFSVGSTTQTNPQISPPHIVKHSPTGLPPGHILVSSGGQLIMANTGNSQAGVMPPPPPKIQQGGMPPISVSPMITNVTAAVSQVIPAVAQQVLGQQTVLVNALPAPFVLQSGVTMTMDGSMAVGQNMQLPQLVAGNVIQQQIQLDNSDPRRAGALLSPETKKKGKKRKMSSQTVANMLHIAAQQNSGVVMSQQGFPQQIQMAHSPQGLTGPVMQALTIVPSKTGGPPQIVMNGQPTNHIGAQQLINSQPTQQINLLQPVNLINGTTGVVQNFPTIQQFIVPNLGGMVMNPDGTATLLQDTSNIGMQLQLQNVNGQNVLTPVQNNGMFNGGQSILAASPAGMVIRTPTSQGKIIQQQQHSPGAQFLSPNGGQFVVNGAQFSGQLSPLVASVSPSQQVTFGTSTPQIRPSNSMQQAQQEFIQCGQMGQTLMVPCAPTANIAVSSSNQQNTTFVQQNTTIVQQQTTMVSNNQQQLQNFQAANNQQNQNNVGRTTTLNVDQNFIISSNDNKQVQALLVQRESPQNNYRHSVSTQTAVNQNAHAVTTNTFCQTSTLSAGSPPDTTTHSPLASGGQSPPTADTTTHSGSTDDGLSPAPSNCSAMCDSAMGRQTSCTMAMVHCISSSEPDSADLNIQNSEHDWSRASSINTQQKTDILDVSSGQIQFNKKQNNPTHVAYAESSTAMSGLHFISDPMKAQEAVVSSHNFDKIIQKRKSNDTLLVMETHHMHSSLFDEEEDIEKPETKSVHNFVVGDLVWGPAKTCPAWPGKITEVDGNDVSVKWFGSEKLITKLDKSSLQTLTEGLDAHHHARKKSRTSRKLNSHLEKAIQEAMAELDKDIEQQSKEPAKMQKTPAKKVLSRLRSGHR